MLENKVNQQHDWITFDLYSIEPIRAEEAKIYQTNRGYMVAGYGFYSFKCDKVDGSDGKEYYHASWRCSTSCD